jgi:hypothetical protein
MILAGLDKKRDWPAPRLTQKRYGCFAGGDNSVIEDFDVHQSQGLFHVIGDVLVGFGESSAMGWEVEATVGQLRKSNIRNGAP